MDADLHGSIMADLVALAARYTLASADVAALELERGELYAEARELNPSTGRAWVTFKEIAGVFGVTTTAVGIKLRRHQASVGGCSVGDSGAEVVEFPAGAKVIPFTNNRR